MTTPDFTAMTAPETLQSLRVVKLRVNAAGSRRIGDIHLRSQQNRASDLLNEPTEFLSLHDEVSADGSCSESLLRKFAIAYVEIVNEPSKRSGAGTIAGSFRLVAVHLARPELTLDGELFVPEGFAVEAVLNDDRPFLNLRNVSIRGTNEAYSYLAVGKGQLVACEVLGGVPD
ncbi:MAG: hypothetical protein AAGA81_16240 [Acidobacteriota bacterium]